MTGFGWAEESGRLLPQTIPHPVFVRP
jgi:hypothetical protein